MLEVLLRDDLVLGVVGARHLLAGFAVAGNKKVRNQLALPIAQILIYLAGKRCCLSTNKNMDSSGYRLTREYGLYWSRRVSPGTRSLRSGTGP